jgi:hypothetical protein
VPRKSVKNSNDDALLRNERLIHQLADVRIMQAQVNALETILTARVESDAVIDAEEIRQRNALVARVSRRLWQKAHNLYTSLER